MHKNIFFPKRVQKKKKKQQQQQNNTKLTKSGIQRQGSPLNPQTQQKS